MNSRIKDSNPRQEDTKANYNPTARNFDHTDVSGALDNMGGDSGGSEGGDEQEEDHDPAFREVDLENQQQNEGANRDEEMNKEGAEVGRAREQEGPVK